MIEASKDIERNVELQVTTNLTTGRIDDLCKTDVQVAASLHTARVDEPEAWMIKALKLHDSGNLHHVVMMVTERNRDTIRRLYDGWYDRLKCIVVPIDSFYYDWEFNQFKYEMTESFGHAPFEHDYEHDNFFGNFEEDYCFCSSGLIVDSDGSLRYCWPRAHESVMNVFTDPLIKIPPFHFCDRNRKICDKEVVRCSFEKYPIMLERMKRLGNLRLNRSWMACNA
jgi:hypothetical protein